MFAVRCWPEKKKEKRKKKLQLVHHEDIVSLTKKSQANNQLSLSQWRKPMPWTKPDFEEISLNMEVTAYVNTDAPFGLTEAGSTVNTVSRNAEGNVAYLNTVR